MITWTLCVACTAGLQRELYALVGGMPPLAPATTGFKAKPNLGGNRVTRWYARRTEKANDLRDLDTHRTIHGVTSKLC